MLTTRFALAVALLASTVSAFFPWFPDYRCVDDGTCLSKRISESSVGVRGVDTLKLVQRLPENELPREVRIARLADRLERKYDRDVTIQDRQIDERSTVEKRVNTYTIYPATTPTQSNSAGIDQDGTDYSYFAQVGFGSANTMMYMLLDTGADTTWVMSTDCTSAPCKDHNNFGPANSTTLVALSKPFSISYGSGAVAGMLVTDNIEFAGMVLPMTFGLANTTSSDFNSFPIDGILGLSLTKSSTPSFIDTLVASKSLKSNIFGICLNREADGQNTGEINFGAPDTSRYTGSLTYMTVDVATSGGDWSIPMDNVGFGTKQGGITGKQAYIDTGTSFIFCPPADAAILHALIPGATTPDEGVTYHVPCTTTTSVTFTFGGITFTVSSEDWVSPPANGQCTSNIYGRAVVPGAWLLGDTFLKNVYAVFDIDKTRVGFAPRVAASTTAGSSTATASVGSTTLATSVTNPATTESSGSSSATVVSPGLNGHQTSAGGTAAAETSSPASTTTTTSKSGATTMNASIFATLLAVMIVLAASST